MTQASTIRSRGAGAAVILLLGLSHPAVGDVYTYECDVLPEEAGWTEINAFCLAEQWTENGYLFQHVPLCPDFPGYGSQFDHELLIGDLSQETAWFAEWRVETDGPSEELGYTAPAHLLVWDGNFLSYHFTIADDQFRLIANDFESLHDLEPGVPHTFRVELFGENLGAGYGIYVDGEVIFSGVPVGPLWNPPWPPEVKFRAKSKIQPSTTVWDYIRWGTMPIDGSGDFNSDGEVDEDDLFYFAECLSTPAGSWPGCAWGDFDSDGDTDCDDAAAFAAAWTGEGEFQGFAQCLCPADLDGSGSVDAADLAQLLGTWGECPGCLADLNGDDLVNAADLASLLGSWGPCS